MKRYRGTGCVSNIAKQIADPSTCIQVRMQPDQVHFFVKIMEAHSHLAFISPINSTQGVVALFATPDNMPEVSQVLANFPFKLEIVK